VSPSGRQPAGSWISSGKAAPGLEPDETAPEAGVPDEGAPDAKAPGAMTAPAPIPATANAEVVKSLRVIVRSVSSRSGVILCSDIGLHRLGVVDIDIKR
jgi:hypothetical protein